MKIEHLGLVMLLALTLGTANSEPITATVPVGDKEWAHVNLFTNLSWNDIDAVCPEAHGGVCEVGGTLNGWTMTGWTWATVVDVGNLFGTEPAGDGDIFYWSVVHRPWAPNFFSVMGFEHSFLGRTAMFIGGWTATYLAYDFAIASWVEWWPHNEREDISGIVSGRFVSTAWSSDSLGAWFYRPTDPDTVPNPFAFEPVTGAGLETLLTSNAVTITGINAPAAVTVSGGEYSIGCTASFTATPGLIQNNQAICVRHQTAATHATQATTTLTIGGVSAEFVSTTLDDPGPGPITTPHPFNFEPQTGVLLSMQVTSAPVIITGIEAAADVTVSNGSYSVGCTEGFTTAPGTIDNGETVCVRHVSAATCLTSVTTTLTVGGVQGTFTSTTIDDSVDSDGDGVSDCLDQFPFDPKIATPPLPGGNQLVVAIDEGALSGVAVVDPDDQPNQAGRPENYDFPWGLASYSIIGIMPGSSVEVELTFPSALPANAEIWKYSEAEGFVPFGAAVIAGATVTLTLTDGGDGDADGEANGVIVDPVGVAVPAASPPPPPPPPPPGGSGGGGGATGLGSIALLILAAGLLPRRTRGYRGHRAVSSPHSSTRPSAVDGRLADVGLVLRDQASLAVLTEDVV